MKLLKINYNPISSSLCYIILLMYWILFQNIHRFWMIKTSWKLALWSKYFVTFTINLYASLFNAIDVDTKLFLVEIYVTKYHEDVNICKPLGRHCLYYKCKSSNTIFKVLTFQELEKVRTLISWKDNFSLVPTLHV